MIQIGNTLVSLDLIEEFFCCDISKCKGQCCVEGDAGAPVTPEEDEIIKKQWAKAAHLLNKENIDAIENGGTSYIDEEGDLVTNILNGRDCVFSFHCNGNCMCALEKAHEQKLVDIRKPISCALYPVRLTEYPTFTAVNLHKWNVCRDAFIKGRKEGIRAYQFLKKPLTDIFGEDWFAELDLTARVYIEENIK